MKAYREWRISGDTGWLARFWPKVKQSLDYCIETWDPGHKGVLEEPHHNTYDIEFWGPDGMCSSFYLGALKAACLWAKPWARMSRSTTRFTEKGASSWKTSCLTANISSRKSNGRACAPNPPWSLKAGISTTPRKRSSCLKQRGPSTSTAQGCLSDGVLGAWIAEVCGVGEILDPEKVKSHLAAVHHYNFKKDLSEHANPQRPSYALGREAGLLLCTWPKGGKLSLPFVYSDEVWTGIEYQVASHLLLTAWSAEALEIVRALRDSATTAG